MESCRICEPQTCDVVPCPLGKDTDGVEGFSAGPSARSGAGSARGWGSRDLVALGGQSQARRMGGSRRKLEERLHVRKSFPPCCGEGCPERLYLLHLWRLSRQV